MAVEIVYETHATTTDNEASVATGWLVDTRDYARSSHREGQRKRTATATARGSPPSSGEFQVATSLGESLETPHVLRTPALVRASWLP
jgi:hypothetical protein